MVENLDRDNCALTTLTVQESKAWLSIQDMDNIQDMITELKTEYEVYKVVSGKYTAVYTTESKQDAQQVLEQDAEHRLLILNTYKQTQNEKENL